MALVALQPDLRKGGKFRIGNAAKFCWLAGPHSQSLSRNPALNRGRPASAVYNAYAVSASTLAMAKREPPAYHVERSAVSGKLSRAATEKATISVNTPNRVRMNTRRAA